MVDFEGGFCGRRPGIFAYVVELYEIGGFEFSSVWNDSTNDGDGIVINCHSAVFLARRGNGSEVHPSWLAPIRLGKDSAGC